MGRSTDPPSLMATPDASSSASADRSLRGLLFLLATIAGVSVANIYYNQPLLDNFRSSFPGSASWVGAVPAVTQLGYAAGMLLLAPLGDRFDRRRLILLQIAGMCVALIVAAAAPTLLVLIAASLAIGVLATIAQQAVPFAAELAPPSERGHAVGTVMSGLLLGILLARTASGVIAEYFGWRAVFGASVVALLALAVVIILRLPKSQPTSTLPYGKLLVSMWHLVVEHRALREASLTGAAMFAAFSIFWSVLALLLAGAPFHLGPQAAGLFGIVGAAGAMAAPLAGKFSDKRGPRAIITLSIALVAVSFVVFGAVGEEYCGPRGRRDHSRYRRAGRADFKSVADLRAQARCAQPREYGVHGRVFHWRSARLRRRRSGLADVWLARSQCCGRGIRGACRVESLAASCAGCRAIRLVGA